MNRACIGLALAALALDAHAVGRLADVEIIDRATGAVLETHYHRGEYWVAGTPGGRYSIAIRNRLGERLLAVTAVDGVNVISGDTAAWQQTGYVFAPFQGYEIAGWRKSNHDVATFVFTASPNSYAARTGRPANVGVIGVALFRERRPEPAVAAQPRAPAEPERLAAIGEAAADAARPDSQLGSFANHARGADAPTPKLGTGHGERETSYVEDTQFSRASETPGEVIRIRYDSLENLLAMGVLRARPPLASRPNPFPDSPGSYVPDPPGYSAGGLR